MRICNMTANNFCTVAYVFIAICLVNHPYLTSFLNRHKEIIFFFYASLRGHRHYWFLQNSLQAVLQCMQELLRAWSCCTRFPPVVQTKCFFLLSSSVSYRMWCYMKSLLLVFRKVLDNRIQNDFQLRRAKIYENASSQKSTTFF